MPATGHPSSDSHRQRPTPYRGLLLAAAGLALAVAGLEAWRRNQSLPTVEPGLDPRAETPFSIFSKGTTQMPKIQKTEAEWRAQLTPEQYEVTRRKGTERAFTGEFWNHHEQGTYKCVGCGAELFTSDTKYDSGCGWPSFFAPGKPENFHSEQDLSHGMVRTEVTCNSCGAHLGHLFDDGPLPSGQRYCMNSASLQFEKKPAAQANKTAGDSETTDESR